MPGMGFSSLDRTQSAEPTADTKPEGEIPTGAIPSDSVSQGKGLETPGGQVFATSHSLSVGSSPADEDLSDKVLTKHILTGSGSEDNMRCTPKPTPGSVVGSQHLPAHTTVASASEIDVSHAPVVPRVSKLPPPPAPPGSGGAVTGMAALSQPVVSGRRVKAKRAVLVGAPPPVSTPPASITSGSRSPPSLSPALGSRSPPSGPRSPPSSLSRSQLRRSPRPSMSVGKPARARMVGLPPSQTGATSPSSTGGSPLSRVPENRSPVTSPLRLPVSSEPPLPSVAASRARLARFSISPHTSGSSTSSSSQGSARGALTPKRARMVGTPPVAGIGASQTLSAASVVPLRSPPTSGRGVRARMVGMPPADTLSDEVKTPPSPIVPEYPKESEVTSPQRKMTEDEYLQSILADGDSDDEEGARW